MHFFTSSLLYLFIVAKPNLTAIQRVKIATTAKYKHQKETARPFGVAQSTVSYCVAFKSQLRAGNSSDHAQTLPRTA
jgi:hypothetical protein